MRPSIALHTHRDAIRAIALSHRVTNVRVFGSVVHGDDTDESDLDILVEPTPETTLMDIAKIQFELGQLLGHPGGRAHPQRPARQVPRPGHCPGTGAVSKADALRVAHGYFKVDYELVWNTIRADLLELRALVAALQQRASNGPL